jgi:hypothetical protein
VAWYELPVFQRNLLFSSSGATLNVEAAVYPETLVNLYQTAWCHIQKLVVFIDSGGISVTRCHILQGILRLLSSKM